MTDRLAVLLWYAGAPVRQVLMVPIRLYRVTFGHMVGGNCRFYPSCSSYALGAIEHAGAVRGLALTLWRVLRCSPLGSGGFDEPPSGRAWRLLHDGGSAVLVDEGEEIARMSA